MYVHTNTQLYLLDEKCEIRYQLLLAQEKKIQKQKKLKSKDKIRNFSSQTNLLNG